MIFLEKVVLKNVALEKLVLEEETWKTQIQFCVVIDVHDTVLAIIKVHLLAFVYSPS